MLVRFALVALLASASITGIAPNPASNGDAGEFVTVQFSEPTDVSNWSLADGESTADLPNRTVSGTVALSTDPEAARNRTDATVAGLQGSLSLSNSGEWVALRAENQTVDNVTYPSAPTAGRWTGNEWMPLGATDFPPFAAQNVTVSSFTLPDDPRATTRCSPWSERTALSRGVHAHLEARHSRARPCRRPRRRRPRPRRGRRRWRRPRAGSHSTRRTH